MQHDRLPRTFSIFEVWRLHEEEADLILKHADEHTLRRRLRKQGMSSLLEDDLSKVSDGTTTLAEMQTVGGFGSTRAEARAGKPVEGR